MSDESVPMDGLNAAAACYLEVAVCLPLARTFIYRMTEPVDVGCRVVVPFNRREAEGFVVALGSEAPETVKVLPVLRVIDQKPLIRPDIFQLCRWISGYYLAPLGEVLKGALPPGITPKHADAFEPGEIGRMDAAHAVALTDEQVRAFDEIKASGGFKTILLHGVTASGKTEIYLRAAGHFLAAGKTALVLVPEIALTPQLASRFMERFAGHVAVLHSSLTRKQRIEEWVRIYKGSTQVVIGTRSAVFAPLANLGLIVVDEEHETSYKQEETPRYHGRDTAIVRAKLARALAVLGSATPSMESFRNAQLGKYKYVALGTRVEDRPLPEVEVVNMREEYNHEGRQILFSTRLRDAVSERLERGEQTIILLNRRGYAMFLLCRHCGFAFQCSSCSVSMTYHKTIHKLLCHYCGLARTPPERCPQCESEFIYYVGEGTQKVESELKRLFSDARVGRVDRDTMRHVRDYERVLGGFRDGTIDVLVGTQMIAKGHDFPGVTLVGVLAADGALSLPDFRAAERTFQLLTQVAGRSGRGDRPGQVVIQSYFPDHYTFQLACTHRFEDFYAHEVRFRKVMFYPPFTSLASVLVRDHSTERASRIAREVGDFLDSVRSPSLRILGPAPSPLARINKVFRHQLLLKSSSRPALHQVLTRLGSYLEEKKIGPSSVLVDVDPVSLL